MGSAPPDRLRASLRWVIPALPPLVVFAVFPLAVLGTFQWDDYPLLVDHSAYRGFTWSNLRWMFSTNLMGHYMPITWISYALDHALWGLDPFGYHLTNLVLHATNTTLVYLVGLRLLRAAVVPTPGDGGEGLRIGAAFAALLFGIHPLRVESVVWITERLDLLCGFFYLLAILMYLRACEGEGESGVGGSRRHYWAAVAMYVFSLLSKSMAVTLPVVLLILDVYPLRRLRPGVHRWATPGPWRIWREKLPFLLAAVLAGAVAFRALLSFAPATSWDRLGLLDRVSLFAYSVVFYLWKTLIPLGLSPLYELILPVHPFDPRFLLSGLVVLVITGVAFASRRRWPGLLAVWIGYGVMLFPVGGIFHKGHQVAADRYTYLPGIGWALLAGAVALALWRYGRAWPGRRTLAAVLVFSTIPLLGLATWRQVGLWQDGVTLWRHAVRLDPASPIALSNLGWELLARGELVEAAEQSERALLLRPDYAEANLNLGLARAAQGRAAEAERHLRRALEITPRSIPAQSGLGSLLQAEGRVDEAIDHFRQALQINPRSARAHNNLGTALARSGRIGEALAEFSEAVRLDPNLSQAQNNLGLALAHMGRLSEARDHFQAAVRSDPGFQEAQRNLANAQRLLGR